MGAAASFNAINHLQLDLPLLKETLVIRHTRYTTVLALFVAAFCAMPAARAQAQPPEPSTTTAPPAPQPDTSSTDDDGALDIAEPDFIVINLPSTLRLPVHGGNFRLTHRFEGNLRSGDFGSQLSTLFGVDVGAAMQFEYRFGIAKHLELIASRANRGAVIAFSAKYDAWHQNSNHPVSLSAVASIEGEANFGANAGNNPKNYAPALGLVVSRKVGDRLALYADPFWVHGTAVATTGGDTGFLGLGARARLSGTTYFIAEVTPRIGGLEVVSEPEYGFGIEKRVGAHVFALTVTNGTANTTYRQLARGFSPGHMHLGFTLTRKFF